MEQYDIGYPHSNSKRIVKRGVRTIQNRKKAFQLGYDYYDGSRENGYGGYNYDGRWLKIIPSVIRRYGLTNDTTVLEIGCKKGL